MNEGDLWPQQNLTSNQTVPKIIRLRYVLFPDIAISLYFSHNWPSISCDLTHLNIFYEVFWSLGFMHISSQLPASWRRKLSTPLTKLSHIYANRSWKILTNGWVYTSKAIKAMYSNSWSIHIPKLTTLWINKEVTIIY